jgi:Family of unknown function (DUF6677)
MAHAEPLEAGFAIMPKKAAEKDQLIGEGAESAPANIPRPATAALVRLCAAGWLIPGFGHFLLGKKWRGLIFFASIVGLFLFGLAMKGEFYATGTGSYLETLGYFGELCVGIAMPTAKFFGYAGDPFFASSDYGTAYLVVAGMLNVLTVIDAFDIAMGRKP